MRTLRLLWVVPGVIASVVASGCSRQPENLVLVTMDTTRADHIGCYGHDALTPVIDAIADQGTVFERAITSAPITAPAHSSIMTGRYPPFHQIRDNGTAVLPDDVSTLAELFKGRGYRTAGLVSAYPVRSTFGFDQGFDYFSDHFDAADDRVIVTNLPAGGMARRPGGTVASEFVAWLRDNGDRPFFAWLHFFDPHMPYEAPAEFADLFPARPYDAEIAYMDHCIGLVKREIERLGLDRQTGWVLVGDHGEGLGEHGEETHALLAYNSTLHVPFVTSFPHVSTPRSRVPNLVSVVDILPTVAEIYDLEPDAKGPPTHGVSLLPLITGKGGGERFDRRVLYFENLLPFFHYRWVRMHGVVRDGWKLIRGAEAELYDLDEDFSETRKVDDPERTALLLDALENLETELVEGRPAAARAEIDSDDIRQLEALGYLGAGDAVPDLDEIEVGELMDPAEGLQLWYLFNSAQQTARSGNTVSAVTKLEDLLQQQPVHKDARTLLAHLSTALGDLEYARALYDGLLSGRPEIDVLHQASDFYLGSGNDPEMARECLEQLLAQSPDDIDALTRLGKVELAEGRIDAAIAVLQHAVAVNPGARDALLLLARIADTSTGEPHLAERYLRQVVEAHPFDPVSHFNLAVHLSRTDRWEEAVRHLERASAYAPGGVFPRAHLALASYEAGRGNEDLARVRLREVLLATHDPEIHDAARAKLDVIETTDR